MCFQQASIFKKETAEKFFSCYTLSVFKCLGMEITGNFLWKSERASTRLNLELSSLLLVDMLCELIKKYANSI